MHINRVTVHGFKSYNDTVVFGPFAQGKNALVGLNGTGKSNFYAAIGFVLLDEFAHIRVADRKALLHEGQGQNSMTAYVEIVFDNKSRTIPIDNDEVSIRRSIGLKKDEYFIDRKNSTRQDVHNLLESCGFSPSSGYYIVRQGQINALALMKDSDRLDLLYDIAGTKLYDQRREESMKMIKDSDSRTEKINESLQYIQNKLAQLEGEKEELEEYEKIDKEKRAVEYLIQDIELKKVLDDLDAAKESKQSASENAANFQRQYDEIHTLLKDKKEDLDKSRNKEKRLKKDMKNSEKERDAILVSKTKTESTIENLKSELQNVQILTQDFTEKLNKVELDLLNCQNELQSVNTEFESVSEQEGELKGKVDALSQIVNQTFRDTKPTEKELAQSQETLKNYQIQSDNLTAEINSKNENLEDLKPNLDQINNEIEEINSNIQTYKLEQRQLMDKKKELDRKENKSAHVKLDLEEKLRKLNAKLNSSLPSDYSSGIDAIQGMKERNEIEGIYGPVYQLISCPDDLAIAVSTVGKGRLFNVVVENNQVGVDVVNTLINQKLGSATLLSLETLNERSKPIEFPETVTSLSSQLMYDEKFEPVINLVFGQTILAHTIEEANELVKKYKMDAVTINGDFLSAHGPMTGGSMQNKHSPILIQSKIQYYQNKFNEIENEYQTIEQERKEAIEMKEQKEKQLSDSEEEKRQKEKEKDKLTRAISDLQDEIDSLSNQLTKLTSTIQEAERRCFTIEKRLEYLQNFNSQVDQSTLTELKEYQQQYEQIREKHNELLSRKNSLISVINKNLIPHQRKLQSKLVNLDPAKLENQISNNEKSLENDNENLDKLASTMKEIDDELKELTDEINSLEKSINSQQTEEENLKNNLSYHQNQEEIFTAKITLFEQRRDKFTEQQKASGARPEEEIHQFEDQSMSQLMRHLKNINQELNRFRHVNKKANEQHRDFTQQQKELIERQQELQQSKESIQKLIDNLDENKGVAFAKTFQQISEYFKSILTELEPNAHGQLVLQCDEKTKEYSGIAVKAQFEDQEVTTLAQLSGGQKALIALTLVFSIQKYSPAPFYLFDEVDSALDDKYRVAVSNLIDKFCHPNDGSTPVQIIFTTFKKELLNNCDKYFAVKYTHGHSTALEISEEEADSIVSEHNDETF